MISIAFSTESEGRKVSASSVLSSLGCEVFLTHKSSAHCFSPPSVALGSPSGRRFGGFWLSDGSITHNLCTYLMFYFCLDDTQHLPPPLVPAATALLLSPALCLRSACEWLSL